MRRNNQEPTLPLVRLYLFLHSNNPKFYQHLKETRTVGSGFFLELQNWDWKTGCNWIRIYHTDRLNIRVVLFFFPPFLSVVMYWGRVDEQCYVSFRCIHSDMMFACYHEMINISLVTICLHTSYYNNIDHILYTLYYIPMTYFTTGGLYLLIPSLISTPLHSCNYCSLYLWVSFHVFCFLDSSYRTDYTVFFFL